MSKFSGFSGIIIDYIIILLFGIAVLFFVVELFDKTNKTVIAKSQGCEYLGRSNGGRNSHVDFYECNHVIIMKRNNDELANKG